MRTHVAKASVECCTYVETWANGTEHCSPELGGHLSCVGNIEEACVWHGVELGREQKGTIEGRWRKKGTDRVRPWEGFPVSFWDKKLLGNDEN